MPASTDSRTPSRLPWRSANAAMVSVSPNPALRVGERGEEGGREERRERGEGEGGGVEVGGAGSANPVHCVRL